ncbi:MAG: HD family phosphohydrolase [Armatimonadota bacterium]
MRSPPNNRNDGRRRQRPKHTILGIPLGGVSLGKALVFVGATIILYLLLSTRIVPQGPPFELGKKAPRDVRAPRAVTYVDTEATALARQQARDSEPARYEAISTALPTAVALVNDVFDVVQNARANPELTTLAERLRVVRGTLIVAVSDETLRTLLTIPDPNILPQLQERTRSIVDRRMTNEIIRDNTEDLTQKRSEIADEVKSSNLAVAFRPAVIEIAQLALRPNQKLDEAATEEAKEAAAKAVEPIRRTLERGELVVRENEVVTQQHLDALGELRMVKPHLNLLQAFAIFFALLAILLLTWGYFRLCSPQVYGRARRLGVVSATLIVTLAAARLSLPYNFFEPVTVAAAAFGVTILAILFDINVGLVTSLAMGLLAGMVVTGNDPRVILVVVLAGMVASFSALHIAGKAQVAVRVAIGIGLANCAILVTANEVFGAETASPILVYLAHTLIAGIVAGVAAILVLSPLERWMGVTTDIRLAELSNPNTPILRQMMDDAPGTYHGSILLATWCETAAEAIGANPLLARVGAYYHDIGKLRQPFYFIENQFGADNPHDRLEPALSARIIARHTKDGYKMAKQLGLPDKVCEMTRQHHGTNLMGYFYHKAREQAGDAEVDQSIYRHVGVKPQFKEAAILMIADSVEAAARTMSDTRPAQVTALVDRITQAKIDDGQLSECPLTFDDIRIIKATLVRILNGMFHQRIEYPEEEREQKQAQDANRGAQRPEAAG